MARYGDIFDGHNTGTVLLHPPWWVETRDTTWHPTMHRSAPTTKKNSTSVSRLRHCWTPISVILVSSSFCLPSSSSWRKHHRRTHITMDQYTIVPGPKFYVNFRFSQVPECLKHFYRHDFMLGFGCFVLMNLLEASIFCQEMKAQG